MKVRRLRCPINDFEAAAMLERGNASPGGSDRRRVNFGDHDSGIHVPLSEHAAPGVDDERMPKRVAPVLVAASLRRCEDEAAVLDRTRPV
jgi:hypothetical protein